MPNTCKLSGSLQHTVEISGKRVSNTWETCPEMENTLEKSRLILHKTTSRHREEVKGPQGSFLDGPASYQLVGEVTAHQGYDG